MQKKKAVDIQQVFSADPLRVFNAWIVPAIMRQWLFVGPASEIVKIDQEVVEGGTFSILEREKKGNKLIDHFGKYIDIISPSRLSFTLSVPEHFPGETVVVITIEPSYDGSLLTLRQTGVDPAVTEDSWRKMLLQLQKILLLPEPKA